MCSWVLLLPFMFFIKCVFQLTRWHYASIVHRRGCIFSSWDRQHIMLDKTTAFSYKVTFSLAIKIATYLSRICQIQFLLHKRKMHSASPTWSILQINIYKWKHKLMQSLCMTWNLCVVSLYPTLNSDGKQNVLVATDSPLSNKCSYTVCKMW